MTAAAQSQYQVRFDWGIVGALAVAADVDVIVVVDVLSEGDDAARAFAALDSAATPHGAIVAGSLRNRTAVADWVLARQAEKADRFSVAIIAVGVDGADGLRFAVEDLLGAGAIIDALAEVGIDYCSPEAAAVCAAFTGMRRAVSHLVSASESGRRLLDAARQGDVTSASEVDVSTEVPVLRGAVTGPRARETR